MHFLRKGGGGRGRAASKLDHTFKQSYHISDTTLFGGEGEQSIKVDKLFYKSKILSIAVSKQS